MANIKSVKKRVITNEISRKSNAAYRTRMRNARRKVLNALAAGNVAEAQTSMRAAESMIAKVAGKGVIRKNTARRYISHLAQRVQAAAAQQQPAA